MSLTVVVHVLVVEMWVGRVDAVQRKRKTTSGRAHGLYGDFVHAQVHDRGQRKALVGLRHPDHLFHPAREKRTVKKTTWPPGKDEQSFERSPGTPVEAGEGKHHRVRGLWTVGVAKWIREKSSADGHLTVPFGRRVHWIGVTDVTFSREGNQCKPPVRRRVRPRRNERDDTTGSGADQGRYCSFVRPPPSPKVHRNISRVGRSAAGGDSR